MYVPRSLAGEDITKDTLINTSNIDKISCPDNLKFSEKCVPYLSVKTLFTTLTTIFGHTMLIPKLAYLVSTSRAESTGLHAVDEVNGYTYIMSNFQHPGDMTFVPAVETAVRPLINQNFKDGGSAAIGLFGV